MSVTSKKDIFQVSTFIMRVAKKGILFFVGLLALSAVFLSLGIITVATFNKFVLTLPFLLLVTFTFAMVIQGEAVRYEFRLLPSEEITERIRRIISDIDSLLIYPDRNIEMMIGAARQGTIFLENIIVPIKKEDINVDAKKIRAYLEAQKAEMEREMKRVVYPPKPKFYQFIEEKILKNA